LAYFDESGFHAPRSQGNGLIKLTVGGCIASAANWQQFSSDWATTIDSWGIPMFHMAKFEARVSPFDKWTEHERKTRLNTLLEILGSTKAHCYAFTNIFRAGDDTGTIYERCIHDTLLELSMNEEKFTVCFAAHPQYKRQGQLLDKMTNHGMRVQICSCSVGDPTDLLPLQAADIVAYEACREVREDGRPTRYPLKRLFGIGCTFRLSAAAE
jgi:hypothetical protein